MTGARRPAVEATSTKCALKGRPEEAGFAIGFVVCWDTPCARSRPVVAEISDPRESCRKLRRVKVFTIGFADRSLQNEVHYLRAALTSKACWTRLGRGSGLCRLVCWLALLHQFVPVTRSLLPGRFRAEIGQSLK